MLRAKQMGLSIAELDQMEEGLVIDMIIEAGNDLYEDEYCQVADQHAFLIYFNVKINRIITTKRISIPFENSPQYKHFP